MARTRKKLGQYLLRWGVITEQQLEEALKIQEGAGKRIGQILIDLNYCTEEDVTKALASQLDLEYIDLDQQDVTASAKVDWLDPKAIRKHLVLPLEKTNGRAKVLIHDPMDLQLMDTLQFLVGGKVDIALAGRTRIKQAIDRLFSETQSSIDDAIREMTIDRGGSMDRGNSMDRGTSVDRGTSLDRGTSIDIAGADGKAAKEDENAPIVRLVQKIIGEAVRERASDIHIEPMMDRVRLRYRIDGVCHERDNIPKRMQGPMITRLKILSGMKIDERRVPQDGRIKLKTGGQIIDFRVSACPAYHGESIVLRILRPDSVKIGLIRLGFEQDTLDQFNKAIRRPNGIFLVTGPTGSGKTTTLYSALEVLNRPDKKIITAEDPVEYNFTGINQCQVRDDIGLTFPMILRSMLRQAPNIVLVGEIRDKEVAEVAIQAALTGHLVFSTLHTNDAPSAITRLIDMGVKPFLVASSIQAVLGQRLIRVLCNECKAPDPDPDPFYLKLCGITPEDLQDRQVMRAIGCAACSRTGYRGRQGIYEYMTMNTELRELAFKRAPASQLRQAAVASGMRTLAGDGRLKVLNGITTAQEVARMAQVGGIVDMEEESAAMAAQ